MQVSHILVIISIVISLFGAWRYILDTIKGKTKPNRISWFLWALAPLIGVGASLQGGADPWSVVRIFMAGFTPLLIFAASFINKNSYWETTKFDMACGIISLLAIALWVVFGSFELAVLFAVFADLAASLVTIMKAWKFPETETVTVFITSLIVGLITLPSIPRFTIIDSSFQIYLIIVNLILIFAISRKKIFKYLYL